MTDAERLDAAMAGTGRAALVVEAVDGDGEARSRGGYRVNP
ncbi:hypothetical protein [Phyllobacterium sp. P5_D12]